MELNLQRLTKANIDSAYDALSRGDQIVIDRLSTDLEAAIKVRGKEGMLVFFGRGGALELLAKLGVWINRNGQ